MKNLKVLFFLIFVAFLGILGRAQSKEEAFSNDPVKLVQAFPNPATDFISLKFDNPLAKISKITLRDIIGNEIQVESEIIDDHEVHLKIKDLPTGYYLITVKQEETNQRSIIKFLKR